MLGIPAASRKSSSPALHEARTLLGAGAGISRIRLLVKPRGPTKKRCGNICKAGSSSGQAQTLALTRGRVRSGNFRNGAHRGSQRRRIREGEGSSDRPCPGAAHSTHTSRMPWSLNYGARDESAGRSDDSSRGILELAATREGTSLAPLLSLPNLESS